MILVGAAAGRIELHARHGVNLIAVSRRGERIAERLRDVVLCPGDVVVLQGPLDTLPERLRDLGCLPLAERKLRLGRARRGSATLQRSPGALSSFDATHSKVGTRKSLAPTVSVTSSGATSRRPSSCAPSTPALFSPARARLCSRIGRPISSASRWPSRFG